MLDLVREDARDGGGPLLVERAQQRRVGGRNRRLILKQQRRDERLCRAGKTRERERVGNSETENQSKGLEGLKRDNINT